MSFVRALLSFLLLPGVVAFLAPALLVPQITTRTFNILLILLGWTAGFRTRGLVIYAIVVAILFHLRVLLHEEPWLARTFPGEWPGYKSRVPRWLVML